MVRVVNTTVNKKNQKRRNGSLITIKKKTKSKTANGSLKEEIERRIKNGRVYYQCRYCRYSSNRLFNVTRHEGRIHSILESPFVCCGKLLKSKGHWYLHCDIYHPEKRPTSYVSKKKYKILAHTTNAEKLLLIKKSSLEEDGSDSEGENESSLVRRSSSRLAGKKEKKLSFEEKYEETESADEWPDDSDDFDGDDEDEECYKNNDNNVLHHPIDNNNNNNDFPKSSFDFEKYKEIIELHPHNVGFFGEENTEDIIDVEQVDDCQDNNNNFDNYKQKNQYLSPDISDFEEENKENVEPVEKENKKQTNNCQNYNYNFEYYEVNNQGVSRDNGCFGEENKENICSYRLPLKKRLVKRFNSQEILNNFINTRVVVQTIAEEPIWNQITARQHDYLKDIDFDNYQINI